MNWITLVIGIFLGAAIGWFVSSGRAAALVSELRSQIGGLRSELQSKEHQAVEMQRQARVESEQRVAAETELRNLRASSDEQRKLLEEAKQRLGDTFVALATDALRENRDAFLTLAKSEFGRLQADARGELE